MVSPQWSGVDFVKKSFVKYNTSFNKSFHSVLSTWKTKDNKNSDTDVAVFELKRKKQAGDGKSSSFCTQKGALAEPSFSSEAFDAIYTLGEEVRYIVFRWSYVGKKWNREYNRTNVKCLFCFYSRIHDFF
jgi:hypothetical protein